MRLAAIDVGSNSVHLVIADSSPSGEFDVVERVKEMVRLGQHSFTTGVLSESAMALTIRALANFRRLTELRHVARMRVVATSAVREARNGAEFIGRIKRETGLAVDVISGLEEARLICRAAQHALNLTGGGPHLLVDIGGGSVELALVNGRRPLWIRSVKLGTARLMERFLSNDPPTAGQCKRLARHLEQEIGDLMRAAAARAVRRAVGTSSSINTLVAMAAAAEGQEPDRLHAAAVSSAAVRRVCQKIITTGANGRLALPAIDAKRVDQMPAAAILTDFILRRSGVAELVACSWALREGLLLELAPAELCLPAERRRRSIIALATRFAGRNLHGRQVAVLALRLFEATAPMLKLPESSRELLEYAALVHDIGHAIDHDRHNRHSYYLVKTAELLNFEPAEVEMIGLAVRAHRKPGAQLDSPEWRVLSGSQRRIVRALIAILRLADALDRSHFGLVNRVEVISTAKCLTIVIGSRREKALLELWSGEKGTELLAKLLQRPVILQN